MIDNFWTRGQFGIISIQRREVFVPLSFEKINQLTYSLKLHLKLEFKNNEKKISYAETTIIPKIKWYYWVLGIIIAFITIFIQDVIEEETGISSDVFYYSFLAIITLVLILFKKRFNIKSFSDVLVYENKIRYIFKDVSEENGKIICKEYLEFNTDNIKKIISKRNIFNKIFNPSFVFEPEIIFKDGQKLKFKSVSQSLVVDKINDVDIRNNIIDLKSFINHIKGIESNKNVS